MSGNVGQNVSKVLDFAMPPDFDLALYDETFARVTKANPPSATPSAVNEFMAGWMGIGYRFLACADHDQAFTSARQATSQPMRLEKYKEERELFGFFISGQAVLESYLYSMYAVGSIVNPTAFPMTLGGHKRAIGPNDLTLVRFACAFPNDSIGHQLRTLVDSTEFKEWSTVRNMQAHRLLPPRHHLAGNNPAMRYPTYWGDIDLNIELNTTTTSDRRKWLAARVQELLVAADDLTKRLWP